jgi:hypothetical protein
MTIARLFQSKKQLVVKSEGQPKNDNAPSGTSTLNFASLFCPKIERKPTIREV